jgi:hypothetical protein
MRNCFLHVINIKTMSRFFVCECVCFKEIYDKKNLIRELKNGTGAYVGRNQFLAQENV